MFGVYKIYFSSSMKTYVGATFAGFEKRRKKHIRNLASGIHHSRYLQSAYDLHGSDDFVFEILETFPEYSTREEVFIAEREWWLKLRSEGVELINPCPNGKAGTVMTEAVRSNISRAIKSSPKTAARRVEKICENAECSSPVKRRRQRFCSRSCSVASLRLEDAYKGNPGTMSDETKRSISSSMKGSRNSTPEGSKLGAAKSTHNRWHVKRGVSNPQCKLCTDQ